MPRCANARREGMLGEPHLRDGIGDLDDLGRTASAGNDHVHMRWPRAKRGEHGLEGKPTVDERISHFVEHDQKMLTSCDGLGRTFPASGTARDLERGPPQVYAVMLDDIHAGFKRRG